MKKTILLALGIALLCGLHVQAQKQNNYWYFGENAGLDFNTEPPTVLTDGKLITDEGCAAMSDENGNLLFYTDGITVYDKTHTVMANGTGLLGDPSASQSALVVPDPASANRFYIFTMAAYPASNLTYSILDITLNGGLGDITTTKNAVLLSGTAECVTAVKYGSDYWILTHKNSSADYYAFKLTAAGIDIDNPVITTTGTAIGEEGEIGYIKANISGNKVVNSFYWTGKTEVMDFDLVTGAFSGLISLDALGSYGVEFSPNSKLLYVHGFSVATYQFDLEAGTETAIQASRLELADEQVSGGAIQLAPNGKLYMCNGYYDTLHVINNPNVKGPGCNFMRAAQTLDGKICKFGLPGMISSTLLTGVLPVTLVKFSAQWQNNKRLATWKTEEELNVSRYDVEYAADGSKFTKIGSVKANGSSTQNSYAFTDNVSALQAISYYRLKIIDTDGKAKYSAVASVRTAQANTVSVSPNPATHLIHITAPSNFKKATIKIFSAKGALVLSSYNNAGIKATLNIAALANGVYVIEIEDGGTTYSSKFIKIN